MHLRRTLNDWNADGRLSAADESLLAEAVDLARRAGEFTLDYFRSDNLGVDHKRDGTEVTDADRGAERLVREYLAHRHPDDEIRGEEEGIAPGASGRVWFIDPIDGTKAFVHGVPLYTNLIAVYDSDGPLVAVVNIPALDECVYAGRELGCFSDGVTCRVSDRAETRGAYLTTSGFDYWPEGWLSGVRAGGFQLRTWGDGYGYALVATGRVEAMVDPIAAPWDLAPMPLLIGEAGGRFTDAAGGPGIDAGSGVATNGRLHEAVLGALS